MSFLIFERFLATVNNAGQKIMTTKLGAKHAIATYGPDLAHHEMHEGNVFSYAERSTMASGADEYLIFTAPAATQKTAHFGVVVTGTGEFYYDLLVNTTDAVGALKTTVINRNFVSSNTPNGKVYAVAALTGGALVESSSSGSGSKSGGSVGSPFELNLRNSEQLTLHVHSGAASNEVTKTFIWYESDEAF